MSRAESAESAHAPGLPLPGDARWRHAPRLSDGQETAFLPFGRPYVPDLGGRLSWLRESGRLALLADGYPARLRDGQVAIHPLDGRYLLEALLAEQEARPRRRLHDVIGRTAAAIVRRADRVGEALMVRYVDTASSLAGGKPHPSALPQAYYAAALARSAQLLGDEALMAAADRFFEALQIPVEEGGVLYRTGRDVAFALVPTRPRDLVLNGWLSTLVALHEYAVLRRSDTAHRLLGASVSTLVRLLPRYDAPDLLLSRYALIGPVLLRLGFDGPVDGAAVSGLRIAVPGEGEIQVPLRDGPRWTARAYPEDAVVRPTQSAREVLAPRARGLRFVAILSRAPYPRPNRVRLRLTTPRRLDVTTTAHIGRYHPAASATVDREWVELDRRTVERGSQDLDIPIPYEAVDLFAYPTNFTRGRPGELLNTYHGTHIVRLRQLASITGIGLLGEWADRWSDYVRRWPSRPELAGARCWTPEGELATQ